MKPLERASKRKHILNKLRTRVSPKHLSDYPIRQHNQLALKIDGSQFYRAMLDEVQRAQGLIFFETYLWNSGQVSKQFIHAFRSAAEQGVHIYMLLDNFGSNGLQADEYESLLHKNIHLHFYNPFRLRHPFKNLHRNHRKLLIVDNRLAFVGGAGISDTFLYEKSYLFSAKGPWRETVVQLTGECVNDWSQLFIALWPDSPHPLLHRLPKLKPMESAGNIHARVISTAGEQNNLIQKALLNAIKKAQQDIWIATPYFLPSLKLRRALRAAAKRGVRVSILLPSHLTDNLLVRRFGQRFYTRLLNAGVLLFEYQHRFMHQKIALCDNWVTLGSSNFDRWSFRWNLEANQEIWDPTFAQQVRDMLQQDLLNCQPITRESWLQRSRWARGMDTLVTQIDRWLDPILHLLSRKK